jgi:hypothetical protein
MLDTSRTHFLPPALSEQATRHRVGEAIFVFVAILWLGLLLGVSFLATAVKFQAPSLDLPTALDVGRVTFALFSKVEWVLCGLLLVSALLARSRTLWLAAGLALGILLTAEALWLLPALDARVGQIIAGQRVPASSHHFLYIAAEGLKAVLLVALGATTVWTLTARRRSG